MSPRDLEPDPAALDRAALALDGRADEDAREALSDEKQRRRERRARAEAALREQARRLQDASGREHFECLRQTWTAFHRAHPRHASFHARPEERLAPGVSWPRWKVDPTWRRFLDRPSGYLYDREYVQWTARPDTVPDGALVAVAVLVFVGVENLRRGYDFGTSAADLLQRIGPRACGAIVEVLAHPGDHGLDPTLRGDEPVWVVPLEPLVRVAASWPEGLAVVRLALEAGWNAVAREVPPSPEARQLLDRFTDSPYGPPSFPLWYASTGSAP